MGGIGDPLIKGPTILREYVPMLGKRYVVKRLLETFQHVYI